MFSVSNQKNSEGHFSYSEDMAVFDCITQTVGNTPMIRLNRLMNEFDCVGNIIGKIESFNPMSSIKDRPAKAMIEALLASPDFNKSTQIIEATSGNNGVSCAWLCAIHAIPLTIVIPEHMSIERQKMIKHFGAKVVTTPKHLGTKGAIDHATQLVKDTPNAVMLDQFANQANPLCHGATTAAEILRDTHGNIDAVIAGVGTGGTITGLGSALKRAVPDIEIIAVEPESCPVLSKGTKGVHKIQGLSSGHVPDVLDLSVVNSVETVTDQDAIRYARILAKKEGLAMGISSGAAACVAARTAADPRYANKNIVVILADTAERYYSTELFA